MTSLLVEARGSVLVVQINNPAQRNALSVNVLGELDEVLDRVLRPDVSAVVITGSSDVFAAGADLKELSKLDSFSAVEFSERGQAVFQRIADAPQLTIAAINGYCMGGGLDLALACDIRVASSNAKFSHPGSRRGIITGWGGTQRLPQLIGRTRSLEMMITAGMYSSEEALELGLITAIGDPVLATAIEIASRKS